jgi:hypothetical protein
LVDAFSDSEGRNINAYITAACCDCGNESMRVTNSNSGIAVWKRRRFFASHLVMRRAPLKAVQELLRHSTIEMTMRYAHLGPDVREDAVRLLDADPPDNRRFVLWRRSRCTAAGFTPAIISQLAAPRAAGAPCSRIAIATAIRRKV